MNRKKKNARHLILEQGTNVTEKQAKEGLASNLKHVSRLIQSLAIIFLDTLVICITILCLIMMPKTTLPNTDLTKMFS